MMTVVKKLPAKKKPGAVVPVKPAKPAIPMMSPQGGINPAWFINDYKTKDDEANAANKERYADILGGYNDRYARNMGYLEGMGLQEAADINAAAGAQAANVQQQMTNSGLGGTVLSTMQSGVERDRIANQARLNERLRAQKLTADMQLSGDTLGFKERREDVAPDLGAYAAILQGIGAGGYGGTGAGGAPVGPAGGAPGAGGAGGIMPKKPAPPSHVWIAGEAFKRDPRTGTLIRDYTIKPKYASSTFAGGNAGGLGY